MYYNRNLFIILIDIEGGVLDTNILLYTVFQSCQEKNLFYLIYCRKLPNKNLFLIFLKKDLTKPPTAL